MSNTTTTFLGMIKPTPGTREPYSRSNENGNLDKVDAAIGPKYANTGTSSASNTTGETQMFGAFTLPANQQSVWKIVCFGTFDNTTGSPTITFRVKIGGVTVATYVLTVGASAGTVRAWRVEGEVICMTTGASGTWAGNLSGHANTGAAQVSFVDATNPTIVRDTTVSNTLEITAQWSAASASNVIRCPGAFVYRVTNT
jgi:hypothetical protein